MFLLKRFDLKLNLALGFLLLAGLVSILSIKPDLFFRQLIFILAGLLIGLFLIFFDWRPFENYKGFVYGIYGVSLFFLVLTPILAPQVRGSKSWIPLGPFQFQTSALASFALIIVLANFFRKRHRSIARISTITSSFGYFILPAALIALQPDLGSILLIFSIWLGFILVSGILWRHLIIVFLVIALIIGAGWFTVLKDYQKERVRGLFFPNEDVLGVNYNVVQSKIAIGSGGLFGKGFGQGTQVQLGFLPEPHTDFIFAALIEEWGLIAGILLILAFIVLIWRIIEIGLQEGNNFNKFLCLGSAMFFMANFIFNVGSGVGLLPVVGVPYPFVSYGGSHILIELMLVGMVQGIRVRR